MRKHSCYFKAQSQQGNAQQTSQLESTWKPPYPILSLRATHDLKFFRHVNSTRFCTLSPCHLVHVAKSGFASPKSQQSPAAPLRRHSCRLVLDLHGQFPIPVLNTQDLRDRQCAAITIIGSLAVFLRLSCLTSVFTIIPCASFPIFSVLPFWIFTTPLARTVEKNRSRLDITSTVRSTLPSRGDNGKKPWHEWLAYSNSTE
jgi:hypothetical protein